MFNYTPLSRDLSLFWKLVTFGDIFSLQDLTINSGGERAKLDAPDEVVKITALLKVFSTVIRSLGDDFMPSKSRLFTIEYMVEVWQQLRLSHIWQSLGPDIWNL